MLLVMPMFFLPTCGPSPDDDTLVLHVNHHVSVHIVGQGIDMRGVLILGLKHNRYRLQHTLI